MRCKDYACFDLLLFFLVLQPGWFEKSCNLMCLCWLKITCVVGLVVGWFLVVSSIEKHFFFPNNFCFFFIAHCKNKKASQLSQTKINHKQRFNNFSIVLNDILLSLSSMYYLYICVVSFVFAV